MLLQSSDPHFAAQISSTACQALSKIQESFLLASSTAAGAKLASGEVRGEIWMLLGLLQLHLLEPGSVVDPCEKAALKKSLLKAKIEASEAAITSRELIAAVNGDDSYHIQALQNAIASLKDQTRALNEKICARPTPPQFEKLCAELSRLCSDLGSVSRTMETAELSRDPAGVGGEEHIWQRSAEQVSRQLLQRYPMYRDLLEPLVTALHLVKHGLRLVRYLPPNPTRNPNPNPTSSTV